jgi:hypothetical protein
MAEEIMKQLKTAGVVLQDADMRKIVQEVQEHPEEVKQAFDLMKAAFQAHAVAQ